MFATLDLGTNNCRMLIARPNGQAMQVVETFSRSVRLGEGIWQTGVISQEAQKRTMIAIEKCADRMKDYPIVRKRFVATEACRVAQNAPDFLRQIERQYGLRFKIISRQEEARLATMACIPLLDKGYDRALIFDIGGGSTEMAWLNLRSGIYKKGGFWMPEIIAWCSLSKGVVSLAEQFSALLPAARKGFYHQVIEETTAEIKDFYQIIKQKDYKSWKSFHLLGTSGTVTTLAALSLGLKKYNRTAVDGMWLYDDIVNNLIKKVMENPETLDTAQNYVGMERADLLLPGCAILQSLMNFFPHIRLRVADRGVREGIMHELMVQNFGKIF